MRTILLAAGLWILAMAPAHAACTGPAGSAGDVMYSADYHVPQYCNGQQWVAMGKPGVSAAINNGLLHYWKLDESPGATTAVDSIGGANMTKTGTADFTTSGAVNNGLNLPNDGTEKSFGVATPADMLGRSQLTLSAWVKRAGQNSYVDVGQEDTDNGGDEISIEVYGDGNVYLSLSNTSATQTYGHFASNDAAWHMVTLVFDGTATTNATKLVAYLDGVKKTLTFDNTPIPTKTTSTAHTFYAGDMGAGYNDAGAVDEVRVYGRALSAQNVLDLYNWSRGNVVPTAGLVNEWKFNELSGANAVDVISGKNGTAINGATFDPAGVISGAAFINGSDDGNDDNNPQFDLGTSYSLPAVPFTLAAWVKVTNRTDWRTIIGKRDVQDLGVFLWQIEASTGNVVFDSNAGSGTTFAYKPPTGTWTHLALVVTSTEMDLYVNGAFQENYGAGFTFGTCGANCHAAIGDNGEYLSKGAGQGADSDPFKGYIDDLRVYNRDLSPGEILSLYRNSGSNLACSSPVGTEGDVEYNAGTNHVLQYCGVSGWQALGPVPGGGGAGCSSPSGSEGDVRYNSSNAVMQYCDGTNWQQMPNKPFANLANGLVGWWKFDEAGGFSASDSSGNGNGGTLTASNASFVAGKVNNAVSLTHTGTTAGGLVSIANPSNFNFEYNQPFSISAWMYRNSNANEDDLVEKEDPATSYRGYGLLFNSGSNSLYAEIQNNGSNYVRISTSSGISTGAWHHVVMTYDGSHVAAGVKLYVDGSNASFTVISDSLGTNTIQTTAPLQIGGSGDGDGTTDLGCCTFGGKIDDVRVFSRVLTEADVRALYGQ